MKVLIVTGRFDDDGGKPSGYAEKLFAHYRDILGQEVSVGFHNGGEFKFLEFLLEHIDSFSLVFWFADVPNDKAKLVEQIKVKNPKCILVTSKRNFGEYNRMELIARALKTKSNLLLEFNKAPDGKILGTLLDPLGNAFTFEEPNVDVVRETMLRRVLDLWRFTRLESERIGDALPIPDQPEFFALAQKYAQVFHDCVHPIGTERFLGNLSFRCESGFPSFRDATQPDLIYVSRRNVDKRDISASGFVAVDIKASERTWKICYYGNAKPSVDTPVQLMIYRRYPYARFILHGHTYIEGAPFTQEIIPCGAIEEFPHLLPLYDIEAPSFAVNLRGHGSLVVASKLDYLRDIKYIPRPFPERSQMIR